jgi:7-cyano-7-deazaguanine synthase
LGGPPLLDLIIEHTHTCYREDRSTRHPWGYGCGSCPACGLRAKGWEKWQLSAKS